jgi:hypothetical protein
VSEGLEQAIATFIGTLGTATLMMATYYFGPGARKRRDDDEDGDEGE